MATVKKHIVSITILLISFYWGIQIYDGKKWVNSDSISEDVEMTYNYLPAVLIYGDVSCKYKFELEKHIQYKIWTEVTEEGKPYFKQTIGTAICIMPFFGVAHLIAKNTSYTADGYSEIYALLLLISGLFYGVLGLFFLSKWLTHYFNSWVVALSLLTIAIATNLNYYVTDHLYSHVYSFSFIAIFLYLTHQWYAKKRIFTAVLIGITLGLITLIRPPNGIVVMFFIFYGFSSFKSQFLLFKSNFKHILVMGVVTMLMVFIQLFYWKITTGSWFVSTYKSHNFGYFDNPQFFNILFSYRRGWLLYTPIMIFAILGFFFALKREVKPVLWAIGLTLLLHLYIISSWNAWWFGGSYGARAMVDYYAILIFPIAAFYSRFKSAWFLIVPIGLAFTVLNIFQEYQHKKGLFHWEGMTKEAYWSVWGQTQYPKDYDKYIIRPDEERTLQGKDEYVSSISEFELVSSEVVLGDAKNGINVIDSSNSIKMYTFPLKNRYALNERNRYAIHVYFNVKQASSPEQYLFWFGFVDENYTRKSARELMPWPGTISTEEQNDITHYQDWFQPFNEGDSLFVSGIYKYGEPVKIDSVKVEHFVYDYED